MKDATCKTELCTHHIETESKIEVGYSNAMNFFQCVQQTSMTRGSTRSNLEMCERHKCITSRVKELTKQILT